MTCRAKELFEVIVGPRQILDPIALEEPLPIAGSDLAEVGHSSSKISQQRLALLDHLQELLILVLKHVHLAFLLIGQQVSSLIDPLIGLPDGRPHGCMDYPPRNPVKGSTS